MLRYFYVILLSLFACQLAAFETPLINGVSFRNSEAAPISGFYKVSIGSKVGIVDSTGETILPVIYDYVNDYDAKGNGSDFFVTAIKDDSSYLFNKKYQALLPDGLNLVCDYFGNNKIVVGKGLKVGLVDNEQGLIIPFKYEHLTMMGQFYLAQDATGEIEVYTAENGITKVDIENVSIYPNKFKLEYRPNQNQLILGSNNGLYGVLAMNGDTIIPFAYQVNNLFVHQGSIYHKAAGGWIKTNGNDSSKQIFVNNLNLLKTATFNNGQAVVKTGGRVGLINTIGDIVIPIQFNAIATYHLVRQPYYVVSKKQKKALFNSVGQQLTKFKYDGMYILNAKHFLVIRKNKCGLIDFNGKAITALAYDNIKEVYPDKYLIRNNGKYGMINDSGELIISPLYVSYTGERSYYAYNSNFLKFETNTGKTHIYNSEGKLLVPALYDEIIYNGEKEARSSFYNIHDAYLTKKGNKYGVINGKTEIMPTIYDVINSSEFYRDSIVPFKRDGKSGYFFIKEQKEVLFGEFEQCRAFFKDYAIVEKNGLKGAINRLGQVVLPAEYETVHYDNRQGDNFIKVTLPINNGLVKQGVFDGERQQFVVPIDYQNIIHSKTPNYDYYGAYSELKDSSFIFKANKEGRSSFGIDGELITFSIKTSREFPEGFFEVYINNYDNPKWWYSLQGELIQQKEGSLIALPKDVKGISQPLDDLPSERSNLYNEYYYVESIAYSGLSSKLENEAELFLVMENAKDNKRGIVDANNRSIAPVVYDLIYNVNNEFFQVLRDGKWGWLSMSGDTLLSTIYDHITPINFWNNYEYTSRYLLVKDNKMGIADCQGNIIIPAETDHIKYDFKWIDSHVFMVHSRSQIYLGEKHPYDFDVCEGYYADQLAKKQAIENDLLGLKHQSALVQQNLAFPVRKNKKWGLIGWKGDIVLPFVYERLIMHSGLLVELEFETETLFYDIEKKQFLDLACDSVFNQRNASYIRERNHSKLIYSSFGKFGLIDVLKKEVIPAQFDAIEEVYVYPEYGPVILFSEDGYFQPNGFDKGNSDHHGEFNYARFRVGQKYGLLNMDEFKIIIPAEYDSIKLVSTGYLKPPILKLNNKMTWLLADGISLHSEMFDKINLLKPIGPYANYYGNLWGDEAAAPQLFTFKLDGKSGIINSKGDLVLPSNYEDVLYLVPLESGKRCHFVVKQKNKFGVVNQDEQIIHPLKYDTITVDSNGDFPRHYELVKNEVAIFRLIEPLFK